VINKLYKQINLFFKGEPDLRHTLINVAGDEPGSDNRGDDNVVGADLRGQYRSR